MCAIRTKVRVIFIVFVILSGTLSTYGQLTTPDFSWSKKLLSLIDTSDYISYLFEDALDVNLMIAASKGYSSEITRLISHGANVNTETDQGASPLIFAVMQNRLEAVKTLLSYSLQLDKVTRSFETPLLIAVKNRNSEITEALIRAGADIDMPDKNGASPLHYASLYGYLEIVDMLLYYDAAIDEKSDEGATPLLTSVWAGNIDVADLLLQNDSDPAESDNEGYTPFLLASFFGDTLMMDLLCKKGADIYTTNKSGYNALTLTISGGHPEAAKYLLKTGDKWTTSSKNALNPYTVVSKYQRKEITTLLRKYNIPGQLKFEIDQVNITASSRFFRRNFYTGLSLSFKEPYINGGFIIGCDTKLWNTPVLIKKFDHLIYQYYDKGAMAYTGLFKEFVLKESPVRFNYSLSASLLAAYTFGNKLKGSLIVPENKFKLVPSITLKVSKLNFALNMGMEYVRTEFYQSGPLWFRVGCSYNYYFDNTRMKLKRLKWI